MKSNIEEAVDALMYKLKNQLIEALGSPSNEFWSTLSEPDLLKYALYVFNLKKERERMLELTALLNEYLQSDFFAEEYAKEQAEIWARINKAEL